jgi:hypothetical protein
MSDKYNTAKTARGCYTRKYRPALQQGGCLAKPPRAAAAAAAPARRLEAAPLIAVWLFLFCVLIEVKL